MQVSKNIGVLATGILFLLSITNKTFAQSEVPTIHADTLHGSATELNEDFSKTTVSTESDAEVRPIPNSFPEEAMTPDTLPPGNLIKVNLATGEETVIHHQLPENLPASAGTDGSDGVAPIIKNRIETKFKSKVNKNGQKPEVQKFSSYNLVNNPTSQLNRKFVSIVATFPNGKYTCSGTLIDQEWVLTAGHCVYDVNSPGGKASKIVIYPGRSNGNKQPYGKAIAKNYYFFQNWNGKHHWNSDMAIIQLKRPIGVITGFMGYGSEKKTFYQDEKFWMKSYPGEQGYNGKNMYEMAGTWDFGFKTGITKPGSKRNKLAHNGGVVVGGSSGGGAYAKKNGKRKVYAVVSHGPKWNGKSHSPEYYTRVTGTKYNWIHSQIQNSRFSQTDLVALNTQLSTKRIVEGKKLSRVTFTVFNKGTNSTGAKDWDFDIYLSPDPNIDNTDTKLGSYTFNYDFQGRQALKVWRNDIKIPIGKTGNQYVGIILNVSDKNTANNNTERWDSRKLIVKPSRELTFTSGLNDGSNLTGVSINVHPYDLKGKSYAKTDTKYRYAPGTKIYVEAPEYSGVYHFVQWNQGGSKFTENTGKYYTVRSFDTDFKTIYELPEVPVKPHLLRGRLSEKDTQNDKSRTLNIVNKHNTSLNWHITTSSNSGWLSYNYSSGTTNPGSTTQITVTMSSDYLSNGNYSDTLLVHDDNGHVSKVPVVLDVGPAPGTAPSPDEIYKAMQIAELTENMGFGMGFDIDEAGTTPGKYFMGIGASGPTTMPGHVYTRTRTDGTWSSFRELSHEQQINGDQFGSTVEFNTSGEIPLMAVGAPGLGPNKPKATTQQTYSGRVALFQDTSKSWYQTNIIQTDLTDGAQFGASVAMANDPGVKGQTFIAIGAPNALNDSGDRTGKVFIYKFINGDLVGPTPITPQKGLPNDLYGKSISLITKYGQTFLLVGAPGAPGTEQTGFAELYAYDGSSWQFMQILKPDTAEPGDRIGSSVALNWNEIHPLLVLGAPGSDLNGKNSGAIFTYRYNTDTGLWQYASTVVSKSEVQGAQFGQTVKLFKTEKSMIMLAGAPAMDNAKYGGEALIYRQVDRDKEWLFRSRLQMPDIDGNAGVGETTIITPIDGKLRFYTSAPGADTDGVSDVGLALAFKLQNPITLPELTLNQKNINTTVPQEKKDTQTLDLQSTGKAALTWSIDLGNTPWLNTQTTNGTIAAGNTQTLTFNLNTAGLDTGRYSSNIILQTNDTQRDCTAIAIDLNVTDTPTGDLRLDSLKIQPDSTDIEAGDLLRHSVSANLENIGTDPIDSTIVIGLYLSEDNQLSNKDTLIATTRIDTGLVAGAKAIISIPPTTRVPASFTPGESYLFLDADYDNNIPELSESNNLQQRQVTVTAPQLPDFNASGSNLDFQLTLKQGDTDQRTVGFVNDGPDTLEFTIPGFASSTASASYTFNTLSSDSIDTPLFLSGASPSIGEVAPGDSGSVTFMFDTQNMSTGTYQDTTAIVTNDPNHTVIAIPMEVSVEEKTALNDSREVPDQFALKQNYPNPFNPTTDIRFELPKSAHVQINIFNMLGRKIETLVDEKIGAGIHNITFKAGNLPSGVYIYRIKAGHFTQTHKMLLLK